MYESTVLANGLRVLTSEMPHTRSVSLGIFFGAGSRYEEDQDAGLSHFLEHMLFKGTERRPEAHLISSAIESVGGMLNASTDREMTVYWIKVAQDHFPLALDLLSDMVLHASLDPDELERERLVILEELAMTYDQPDARADLLIDQTLWPNQPMGRDVGGTKESVRAITREAMETYRSRQYVPNNAVLVVTGNITHQRVVEAAEAQLGQWAPGTPLEWYPVQPPANGTQVAVEHRKTDQAHLCLAFQGVSAEDPRRYALDMLNTVLGEGMSSRLFVEVRERQGLAYEVLSSSSHYRDCGAVTVYCGVAPSKVDAAMTAILGELDRIREGVSEEELSKAKEFVSGRLLLRMEDTRAVMAWLGVQELLRGSVRTPDEVVELVRQTTTAQVREVGQALFTPEAYRLAVVGPYRSDARFRRLLTAPHPAMAGRTPAPSAAPALAGARSRRTVRRS